LETENKAQKTMHPKWKKYSTFFQAHSFIYRIENDKAFIKEGEFENEYDFYTNEKINDLIENSGKDFIEKSFIYFNNSSQKIKTTKKFQFRNCIIIGKISDSEFVNLSFFQSTIDMNFELCHFNILSENKIGECLSFSNCILWNLHFNFCKFVNEVNFSHCKDSDKLSFTNCSNTKGKLEGDNINVNKISIRSCEFERISISTQPIKPISDLKILDFDDTKIEDFSILNTDIDSLYFSVCEIDKFLCRGSIDTLVFDSSILNDSFILTLPEHFFKNPFIINKIKMLHCKINLPLSFEKFKGIILDLSENSFNDELYISFDSKNLTQEKQIGSSHYDHNILVLNHSILNKITNIDTTNIDKVFLLNTKIKDHLYITPNDFTLIKNKFDHTGFVKDDDKKKILKNKRDQAKLLCDSYKKNDEIENEDLAWVEFMKISGKLSKWPIKLIYSLFYSSGKFGTKPEDIVSRILIILILCATFYGLFDKFCLGFINTKDVMFNQEIGSIWNYLYFSVVTFLTIGYGDISPLHWLARTIAGIEGFLGVFFIAYLTISIFRKFTRN